MSGLTETNFRYAVSLALAGLTVFLGYCVDRTDFLPLLAAYAAFFGLYAWVVFTEKNKSDTALRWYAGLGIALRVLLLFNIPNLSDDFLRFLWDGRLTVAGIHPFEHPPDYFIRNNIYPEGITPGLFSRLNSPEYYTVYPPVCQAVFALAAWISPASEWGGVVVMKLFLLLCELGTMRLLLGSRPSRKFRPEAALVLYALNPLIIVEIMGNCHFEGVMIFFLLAGIRALERHKVTYAALWWALATASKLLPLMFLPVVLCRLGRKKGLVFLAVFTGVCLFLFAPLLPVLPNILSSLDLYFRQFQFNASIYYLIDAIGFLMKGYDTGETLGPVLGLATAALVLVIAWKVQPGSGKAGADSGIIWADALLFAVVLQMFFSATVHPWYATVPFALSLFTRWRFPLAWTGLVVLSYSHYAGGAFRENYWLIALEYGVLWYILYLEVAKMKSNSVS